MTVAGMAVLLAALAQAAAPQAPAPGRIAPPFVPIVGAAPDGTPGTDGVMPPPYHAGAQQFLVQPGQVWQHLVEDIRPGDEVILPAGLHVPQVINGLRGTPDRPVFVRSRDRVPAGIVCGDDGLVLRNCRHVVIENLLFLQPTKAALTIDADRSDRPGEPWLADVTVRYCTVRGTMGQAGQDGIRLRRVADVRIDSVRVEAWEDAAVEIADASQVLVRALMTVPDKPGKNAVGVAVIGNSERVAITGCVFNKSIGTGIRIGGRTLTAEGAPVTPVRAMRVDRCIMEEPGTAVEFVAAESVTVARTTIVNPSKAMYAIPDGHGPLFAVLVDGCLGYWTPGALERFSPHPSGTPAGAVTLGRNLWYSKELPTAWAVLGQPFGAQAAPQVTDVDPGLDITDLRARNEGATQFGAYSSQEAPAPGPGPAMERPGAPAPPLQPPPAP